MELFLDFFQQHVSEIVVTGLNALMIYFRQKWAPSAASKKG